MDYITSKVVCGLNLYHTAKVNVHMVDFGMATDRFSALA